VCTDNTNPTYCNEALCSLSCIDHFVISTYIKQCRQSFAIDDSGVNHSDHMPIALSIEIDCFSATSDPDSSKIDQNFKLHWDKACLNDCYRTSGELLAKTNKLESVTHHDNQPLHELNDNYNNIVDALSMCESSVIPRIPCNALKSFWNDDLDALKHFLAQYVD